MQNTISMCHNIMSDPERLTLCLVYIEVRFYKSNCLAM